MNAMGTFGFVVRRRSIRRWGLAGVAVGAALLASAATSWACVGVVSLTTNTASVQPGGTLTVTGKEFAANGQVQIHLDDVTGPVLGTTTVTGSTMTSLWNLTITIPANTSTGQHILIATENEHNMNGGIPARAVIYVGTNAPATPSGALAPIARPGPPLVGSGIGVGVLIAIAVGVALVSAVAAGAFVMSNRRRPQPEAVKSDS